MNKLKNLPTSILISIGILFGIYIICLIAAPAPTLVITVICLGIGAFFHLMAYIFDHTDF